MPTILSPRLREIGVFVVEFPFVMLIGVVVNDDVILVDGHETRRRAEESLQNLVIDGTLECTRHIVITMIAGFLPLVLSRSLLWPLPYRRPTRCCGVEDQCSIKHGKVR